MRIVELIIDEFDEDGVEAISIVESPAIEENFIALKGQDFKLKQIDDEKRILAGPILIPNKPIYRNNGEEDYYIYFSRDTVRKASQMYLQAGNQSNATLEHAMKIGGLTLVESWLVEDKDNDKSNMYGMDVPLGTWFGAMKVENEDVWQDFVKTGKVQGFSIEGYFADKMERPKEPVREVATDEYLNSIEEKEADLILSVLRSSIKTNFKDAEATILESFTDYPQSVKNNAKRGLKMNESVNNKCATQVGKVRAQQLSQGKGISKETVKRMYSYLSRAEEYYDENDSKACGTISYLLWGGKAALGWSRNKLREMGELDLEDVVVPVNDDYIIINNRLAYSSQEIAEASAEDLGCEGFHTHEVEGVTWFMPCEFHALDMDGACWKGYEAIGFKMKNGKKVPNCVPIKRK